MAETTLCSSPIVYFSPGKGGGGTSVVPVPENEVYL